MMDFYLFSGKRICVAVSGGVDSVVLLHILRAGVEKYGYSLSVVHCEHGIRGEESLADQLFVEELCQKNKLPVFLFSADCPTLSKMRKCSLETAAREFRYECFERILKEDKADFIALAHNQNDEAETVLFRLLRGTSLTGAGGMVEVNGNYLRPLLGWTRAEIEEYADKNGLAFRIDKTNFEKDATRNKLRLDVLPQLEECVPGAVGNLSRFATLAIEDDDFLYDLAKSLVREDTDGVFVSESGEKPLFRRACLLALKTLGVTKDYTAKHIDNALSLLNGSLGARQSMPKGIEVKRVKDGLFFFEVKENVSTEKPCLQTFAEGVFDRGRYEVNVSKTLPKNIDGGWKVLRFDGDKMPKDAVFRFRQEGDKIRRFGGGSKTLKKFFNEEKISVEEREFLPLLADAETSRVYVVCGVEISELVKCDESTKRILYLSIMKKTKEKGERI